MARGWQHLAFMIWSAVQLSNRGLGARAAALVVLGLLLGSTSPALAGPEVSADDEPAAVARGRTLRRLRTQLGFSRTVDSGEARVVERARRATETAGRRWTPAAGLGQAIQSLRHHPFANRPAVLDESSRRSYGRFLLESHYRLRDPEATIDLAPERDQLRAHELFWQLGARAGRELGTGHYAHQPEDGFRGIAVLEGGAASRFGASTAEGGSIVIHRATIEQAERIGAAVAASDDSRQLIANLEEVARGTFKPPGGLSKAEIRRNADAALAWVIGHEMAHGLKEHGAIGEPRGGPRGRLHRARELQADAGGLELALRAGHSPRALGAVNLFWTIAESLGGQIPPGMTSHDTHPTPLRRYAFALGALRRRRDKRRRLYDDRGRRRDGAAYMTGAMKRELDALPTVAELSAELEQLPEVQKARRLSEMLRRLR